MFGSWKGSENDNQRKGLVKYWFNIDLKMVLLCFYSLQIEMAVESFVEKGQWWIENGISHDTL
jgi:hypothetical protein